MAALILSVRNELQSVIETLAQPGGRVMDGATPSDGFVQPDRVKITMPLAFGLALQKAGVKAPPDGQTSPDAALRVTVQTYDTANPPPPGIPLGTIEMQFVIATKR